MTASQPPARRGNGDAVAFAGLTRAVLDALPLQIAILDQTGTVIAVNEAWRRSGRAAGVAAEKVGEGVNYLNVCRCATGEWSEEAAAFGRGIRDVLDGRLPEFEIEYPCPTPHKARWFVGRVTRAHGETGPLALVTHEEVTQRRLAEQALRDSEQRFRLMAENSTDMISRHDVGGVYLYVSPACRALVGWERHELVGHSAYEFIHEADLAHIGRVHADVLGMPQTYTVTFRVRCKNGGYTWLESTSRSVRDESDRVVEIHVVSRDVTERRAAEEKARQHLEQLAHVSRISVVGELASGLAHEINQPLAAIVNYARGFLRRVESGAFKSDEMLDAVGQMAQQAERASQIVRRLRDFVKKGEPLRRPVDLNHLVEEAAGLIAPEARTMQVRLELELRPGLPRVAADPIQIEQVVLNLLRNGIEAMEATHPSDRELRLQTTAGAAGPVVTLRDTGCGVPEDRRAKVFEPFYSTKPTGMGLGLSISRSIIEAHGGRLTLLDDPGSGAVFQFVLPADNGEAGMKPPMHADAHR